MVIEATSAATSTAGAAASRMNLDYQAFLTLLTAEIQNQDPLEPMSSTDFVSQLAQLSQVEQSVQTNSNLEDIYASISAAVALGDVALIGHEVTIVSEQIELSNGAAVIDFELAETAESAQAFIYNREGAIVRTLINLPTAGSTRSNIVWNGLDDSGQPLADGTYTVDILAENASGSSISYNTYATTTVQQVNLVNGNQTLLLGNGEEVPSTAIITVG